MPADGDIDRNVSTFVEAIKNEDDDAATKAASFLIATAITALVSIASSLVELAETSRPS